MQFDNDAIGALEFTVSWSKDGIQHEERFLGRKFNPVNDIFPREMREALEGKTKGESVTFTYEPRMCIPRHKDKLVPTLPLDRLRPKTVQGKPIIPRVGRFYPQGHINGLTDIYPGTLTPFRLTELTESTFTADRNHPLANIPVTITAKIQHVEARDRGTYGSINHWRESTCDWGPGMQAMLDGVAPDFYLPTFFDRRDDSDVLFSPPSIDCTASKNIQELHAQFTSPDMRILNLSTEAALELEGDYDALSINSFIEYQTDPVGLLTKIKPHLKPGAPVLVSFTNQYDENRVIQGWTELHEFEWMGLVLDYLRQAGFTANAGTISQRNDWRDCEDPHFYVKKGVSDPVYFVYAHNA